MKLSLGTNIAALKAQRRLNESSSVLEKVFERLSSGQRINSASDDAAGLAIAEALRSDVRIYTQAIANVNDGISVMSVAGGALESLTNVVGRLKELAQQAANGSLSDEQRLALQSEGRALTKEYNRIIESTKFNDLNVLDGSIEQIGIQAGEGQSAILELAISGNLGRTSGAGTFEAFVSGASNGEVGGQADFNGDGIEDLVQDLGSSGVRVLLSQGDGTFSEVNISHTTTSGDFAIGDFDGDGDQDIVISNTGVGNADFDLFTNDGNGNFTDQGITGSYTGITNANYLYTTDYNGDGITDIIGVSLSDELVVMSGSSSGAFSLVATDTFDAIVSSEFYFTFADVNDDGITDIITSNSSSQPGVILGSSDGTFSEAIDFGSSFEALFQVGDFDSDGIVDLLSYEAGSKLLYLRSGNGDGTFGDVVTVGSLAGAPGEIDVADIDGDGQLDFVLQFTNRYETYYGNGEGAFSAGGTFAATAGTEATLIDVNNDGIIDIVESDGSHFDGLFQNTTDSTDLKFVDLTSIETARAAIDELEAASLRIQRELGSLGAGQSRLETASQHLFSLRQNFEGARSRIIDADVAQEVAQLVRNQIQQQASLAILAQANISPRLVLDLLE